MASCHSVATTVAGPSVEKIVLVGAPNVGKSLLFHRLTGAYATVSNYPGTTVEVTRGRLSRGEASCFASELLDTPGMRSLLTLTEEEEVTKRILCQERPSLIVHVADAKDLERSLPLTLQLIELGPPVVLVLNMIDEAAELGLSIDREYLQKILGQPVVLTDAVSGSGVAELRQAIAQALPAPNPATHFFLSQDATEEERLILAHDIVRKLAARAIGQTKKPSLPISERLSRLAISPITGLLILLLVLWGLYQFVGVFGAQTAVEFLEDSIFGQYVNPWLTQLVQTILPWGVVQDLLIGEYGILTLGLRYAIAIILPIVATFFLAFALIEDSGYLPRLALLIDRLFKVIGLSGRAVIPIVLGFGCDTMATLVTRTLETRREKVIATLLLALAIPCSAQLGVIFAILAGNLLALGIWAGIIAANFLLIGYLTAQLLPGERPLFYMEIPPLRLPRPSNVLLKTLTRVHWYLKEVLPFFMAASVVIWLGRLTGFFEALVRGLEPLMSWIGLPSEAATAFLFGFFRRDYGAAGLYDLREAGTLGGVPLVVAAVTLTLFVPCIAQFAITVKERGWQTAVAMAAFILPYAFFVGWLVHWVLTELGVRL